MFCAAVFIEECLPLRFPPDVLLVCLLSSADLTKGRVGLEMLRFVPALLGFPCISLCSLKFGSIARGSDEVVLRHQSGRLIGLGAHVDH